MKMKSENWIIVELLAALMVIGVLSFFWSPVYEKGVWLAVSTVASLLSLVFGYKFGKKLPEQLPPAETRQDGSTTAAKS